MKQINALTLPAPLRQTKALRYRWQFLPDERLACQCLIAEWVMFVRLLVRACVLARSLLVFVSPRI